MFADRVDHVMPGVPLVAGEFEHAIDSERKRGVDVDAAAAAAKIGAEGAPRRACHEPDVDAFARRHGDACLRSRPALVQRAQEHRWEPIARDVDAALERGQPGGRGSRVGQ